MKFNDIFDAVRYRGGEIRYHAELSCVELDAMVRKEAGDDSAFR